MAFSSNQLLELFVLLCIAEHLRYDLFSFRSASAYAESNGGTVRADSMPTRLYRLITPLQVLTFFPLPIIYIVAVANDQFHQPPWVHAFAFPEMIYGVQIEGAWKNTVRVLACVASVASEHLSDHVFEHLGDQFHPIGRREKQRIVETGPYAWVRHPLYVWILLQEVLWALMFWSYAPLFAFAATATVLAVKIRIEEEAIQNEKVIGEAYRAYMKKVPARLVPHIW